MKNSKEYKFISEARELHPQLSHASNIVAKASGNLSAKESAALETLIPKYAQYLKKMLRISGYDKTSVGRKVDALNE